MKFVMSVGFWGEVYVCGFFCFIVSFVLGGGGCYKEVLFCFSIAVACEGFAYFC